MKIVQSFLTNNPCYKENRKINPKGGMLHSVGVNQPNALVFVKNWNKETYDRACVHGFIDANDGVIYQTLPWDHRGWHGGGTSNNTHIGVEMCEPSCIKYTGGSNFTCSDIESAKKSAILTYNSAVELFAMLSKMYNWNPLDPKVICSHSEGYKLGIASNHADPEHIWKQLKLPFTMDTFRKAVKEKLDQSIPVVKEMYYVRKSWDDKKTQLGAFEFLSNAKGVADNNPEYSVFNQNGSLIYSPINLDNMPKTPFRVQAENIDIYDKPFENVKNKIVEKGVYTIVDRYSKWGLLKSYERNRNGWIDLTKVKIL